MFKSYCSAYSCVYVCSCRGIEYQRHTQIPAVIPGMSLLHTQTGYKHTGRYNNSPSNP